jgi:phage-related protein
MRLTRLHLRDFIKPNEKAESYPETPNAYQVCCISHDDPVQPAPFITTLSQLPPIDRKAAMAGVAKLLKIANKGDPLGRHYDKKQLHDIHTFTHQGDEHKILRIRTSDTRLLLFHTGTRIILLLDAFAKRTDSVSQGQLSTAETVLKDYLKADRINIEQGEAS